MEQWLARLAHNQQVAGSSPALASMTTDIENSIDTNAQGPRKASGDSGSMEQHSLLDQIEADKYLESKRASRKAGLGIKLLKLKPPGAV